MRQPAALSLWCELEAHRFPLMATPPLSREAMQEAVDAVARHGGSRAAAALELGLPRTTLSTRYHAARAAGIPPCASGAGPSHAPPLSLEPVPAARLGGEGRGDGTRFVVCSDSHGDAQDDAAVEAFLGFVDRYRPTIRVHAGDIWDFRPLRNGASKEEAEDKLFPDIEAGEKFLWRYKPSHVVLGNHDARLWKHAERLGPIAEFCGMLVEREEAFFASMGTKVTPHCVFDALQLAPALVVAHGFAAGLNACRAMVRAYKADVVFGHTHSADDVAEPGWPRAFRGVNIGCLCKLRLGYNETRLSALRQSHAFAAGVIYPDGSHTLHLHAIRDGQVILPQ
jgi:predicted phosphodiesterase